MLIAKEEVIAQDGRPIDTSYLEGTIGYTIRRAQLAMFANLYRAFGDEGLTLVQFSALAVIKDNPDLTQGDLAKTLSVERPRMVPVIDVLEERGLAERIVDPADRRNRRIRITPLGRKVLRTLQRRLQTLETHMMTEIGAGSVEQALDMLWKLAAYRGQEFT